MLTLKVYTSKTYLSFLPYIFLILSIIWFFFFIDTEVKELRYIGYFLIFLFIAFLIIYLFRLRKSTLIISNESITHIVKKNILEYQVENIENIKVFYGSYFGEFRPITFTFSGGMDNFISFVYKDERVHLQYRLIHSDIEELNKIFNYWRHKNIKFTLIDNKKNIIQNIPLPY